uniref:Uncharacterized protein n=3 Tax=Timema TaxID=61471 RepID=A0A7R9G133_TIMSH|nr:unnamed protein product [Timema shepardi]
MKQYFPFLTINECGWISYPCAIPLEATTQLTLEKVEELNELHADHKLQLKYGDIPLAKFWMLAKEYPAISKSSEADIAAAFLPVLPENMEVAKLSFSLGEAEWVILMRRPSESANGSGLFAPFDTTVWLLILTSLILVGPAIFIIIMIRVKLCKGSEKLTKVYPLDACVWFVYGALMKQGSTLSPVAGTVCFDISSMAL